MSCTCNASASSANVAQLLQALAGDDCLQQLRDDLLNDGRVLLAEAGGQAIARVQQYLECQFSLSPAAAQAQAAAAWQSCLLNFVIGLASGKDRETLITEGLECLLGSLLGPSSPPAPEPSTDPQFRSVSRC